MGGRDFYHIGYPSSDPVTNYLRSGYSRVVIDGTETIYPTSSNVKNTILQYLKPYEVRFSSPWKASGPFSTTPDPKIQLVVPGSQKIIETNGEKYLLTITDSSMISRDSLPDETLSNLKVSIANGQSVSKEFSTTLTKTSSLEKISSVNYNFSVGLSSSLFKILSFEAGYDKNLSGS